jgi:Cu-Zn family superoxide dismutase
MSTFDEDRSALLPLSAVADIRGSVAYPSIRGTVRFVQNPRGVMIHADITGLPITETGFFGFHIHERRCGSSQRPTPFSDAGAHFNPGNLRHPRHAGDLPVLMETREGSARLSVLTDRFNLPQVIGRSVVIHLQPDDFRTNPAGMSGARIACGDILLFGRG